MKNQWVWGVDCHAAHASLVAIDGPRLDIQPVRAGARPRTTERLSELYSETFTAARRLARRCPPLMVWVEQPAGAHPAPTLMAAWGVIRCAIFDALSDLYLVPVSVHVLPVKGWKKLAFGRGDASKEFAIQWALDEFDLELDEHQAEAAGVARAGLALMLDLDDPTPPARLAA